MGYPINAFLVMCEYGCDREFPVKLFKLHSDALNYIESMPEPFRYTIETFELE